MCISKKITEKLIAKGIIEERKYGADVYEYSKYFNIKIEVCIAMLLCVGILLGTVYFIPDKVESNEIEQSLTGGYEVMGSIEQFLSAHGNTDRLSDKKITGLTDIYNAKVDKFMSDEFTAKNNYKWLNENMLSETYKETVDYTVKSGIVDIDTVYTFYYNGRNHVKTSARLIGCSVWIEYDENSESYKIRYSCDKMNVKADLKKEESLWKLTALKGQQGEEETTDDEHIIENAENKLEKGTLSEDKKKLLNDIHNIQEICAKGYDTFTEAYKAASVIELGSLNEYDLK